MSKFKGTQGKWEANETERFYNGSKDTYEVNYGNDGECVCEVVHGFDNAKLIAAAPELLEALQTIKKVLESPELIDAGNLRRVTNNAINKALN